MDSKPRPIIYRKPTVQKGEIPQIIFAETITKKSSKIKWEPNAKSMAQHPERVENKDKLESKTPI